jgi:hypothetical protein
VRLVPSDEDAAERKLWIHFVVDQHEVKPLASEDASILPRDERSKTLELLELVRIHRKDGVRSVDNLVRDH